MRVPIAFITIVLIWSTTPLAIQYSTLSTPISFAALARIALAALISWSILLICRKPLPMDKWSLMTYAGGSLGIFGGLSLTYVGAQTVPSGLVAIIYGANPLFTGVFSYFLLHRETLAPYRWVGMLLGLVGLTVIFSSVGAIAPDSLIGVLMITVATLLFALSAVWIKRIAARPSGLALTTGSLTLSSGFYLVTWLIDKAPVPQSLVMSDVIAVVYLAVFGSVLSFTCYFFLIRNTSVSHLSLTTLLAPLLAVMWGFWLRHEVLSASVLSGGGMVLFALLIYLYGGHMGIRLRRSGG